MKEPKLFKRDPVSKRRLEPTSAGWRELPYCCQFAIRGQRHFRSCETNDLRLARKLARDFYKEVHDATVRQDVQATSPRFEEFIPAYASEAATESQHQYKLEPIGDSLRRWRKLQGLTQVQAAKRLGTSVRNIQNWEEGSRMPRGLALSALLKLIK